MEFEVIIRYLDYKCKLLNLSNDRVFIVASSMSSTYHKFKRGWAKDFETWLNYLNIKEDDQISNIDNIKSYICI